MLEKLNILDSYWLLYFRHLVPTDATTIGLIQIGGEIVVVFVALMLVGMWLYGVYKKDSTYKTNALSIAYTILLVFIIYSIINFGFPKFRPSPQDVAGGLSPLIPHPIDNSFPSGHALFMSAALVGLFRFFMRFSLFSLLILLGLITAFCRVAGGVHYPGDILGGWIIGIIFGILATYIVEKEWFQKYAFGIPLKIASWIRL